MLLTDAADLMETFAALFRDRGPDRMSPPERDTNEVSAASASYIRSPMPELDAPSQSLADVYGESGNILKTMAEIATLNGDLEMAEILMDLEKIVADESLDLEVRKNTASRLLDFVYPVV